VGRALVEALPLEMLVLTDAIVVSTRLPPELVKKLDELAQKMKCDRSVVFRKLLEGLTLPPSSEPAPTSKPEKIVEIEMRLEARCTEFEKKMEELEAYRARLVERFGGLEEVCNKLSPYFKNMWGRLYDLEKWKTECDEELRAIISYLRREHPGWRLGHG